MTEKVLIYCPACGKHHKVEKKTRKTSMYIKGESVEYEETYYVCDNLDDGDECREFAPSGIFFDNLLRAKNEYRKKKGLPLSNTTKEVQSDD